MTNRISIICPLYNAEDYLSSLDKALNKQEDVNVTEIKYILTKSSDNTKKILDLLGADYREINSKDFSHSLTREEAVMSAKGDIIIFITQDIVIEDNKFLHKLIKPIINHEANATYARQISKFNNIEKYTREYNYPKNSRVIAKDDISKLGLKAFFFSDVASAIDIKIFRKLNGYDQKNLPTNEDMYFAYKLIANHYKIKYCAEAIVYHSHNFTLNQLYNRYKLTGKFMKENSYLNQYGTTSSGASMAKYVLKRILQEKRFDLLFCYPFDMSARLIGMKVGKL